MIDTVTTSTISGTSPSGTTNNETASLSSDFDTFLKMLTAQMKNQDPLDPVDSKDFAVQLATFSSVEQQVLTNDLLKSLTSLIGKDEISDVSNWLGKEVLTTESVYFDQTPVELITKSDGIGDKAVLVVTDSNGVVQDRIDVTGLDLYNWHGVDEAGFAAQNGFYAFELEVYQGDILAKSKEIATFQAVSEVQIGESAPELVLASGRIVSLQDALGVRPAS